MTTYFIKSEKVARKFERMVPAIKAVYQCCPECDKPMYYQSGYLVSSSATRTQLKKQGIMVSSALFAEVVYKEFERAEDDGRCVKCEGWGCETCCYSGGY
jgi:hypothetical protein